MSFSKEKATLCPVKGLKGGILTIRFGILQKKVIEKTGESFIDPKQFSTWESIFKYFTDRVVNTKKKDEKLVIFLDEIQWMAARRTNLISLLKMFYDTEWKDKKVMLILCGSIASFMVRKIIKSKALYGRITLEILLKTMTPEEASRMFRNKRSKEEVLKYLLVFGGVPKYLEEINLNRSFEQNINALLFSKKQCSYK